MRTIKFLLVYFLAAFITGSWLYNHALRSNDHGDRVVGALFGGLGWPVYWTGKVVFTADGAITAATAPAPEPTCRDEAGNTWRLPADGVCQISHSNRDVPNASSLAPTLGIGGGVVTILPPQSNGTASMCAFIDTRNNIYYKACQ